MEHDSTQLVTWLDGDQQKHAPWRSATGTSPPRTVELARDELRPDEALRRASQGVGMLWTGPFSDARKLLDQVRRRLDRKQARPSKDPAEAFYRYRQRRGTRARILGMLLLRLDADGAVAAAGAPDVRAACREAYGEVPGECVVSLRELLGVLSAHEWRHRGVYVSALDERLHPHYGVFSPTRTDYVDLVATAPMPRAEIALDIGTGTGVLAAVLAQRGVPWIEAVDNSPLAVTCARDNMHRLGLAERVDVTLTESFPPTRADLVVCNPPWIPAAPASRLDTGVFDRDGRMVNGFLQSLPHHLRPGGQGWLVLSDLAESLGLRTRSTLLALIDDAGLRVIDRAETRPRHPRGVDPRDPLAEFRSAERLHLWRLEPKS